MRQPFFASPDFHSLRQARAAARLALVAVAVAVGGCGGAVVVPVTPAVFDRFVARWPGHYSNVRQHAAQVAAGVPDAQRNAPLELRIVKVDLPAFGPHAYYAEWRSPDAARPPVRQRIYAFEPGAARGTILLRLHIWPPDAAFVARTAGAWREPARLQGITPSDMAALPGCDLRFRAQGAAFEGEMQQGRCRFAALDGPSREIYSWSQMKIGAREFSYQDGWYNLDGTLYRSFASAWYVFEKR